MGLTASLGPNKVFVFVMRILVIGGGGREHALVWKLKRSKSVVKIWCIPGNGGIAQDAECLTGSISDPAALLGVASRLAPDLTVVGPEQPLVAGIVDLFRSRGLKICGPTMAAAQLEGSKIFAKQFLERHRIPTASIHGIYESSSAAQASLANARWPLVIKADGPCAGKGVLVTSSREEASDFIDRLMEGQEFGDSGRRILIENALEGRELSFIILTDGTHIIPLAPAQDHKRVFDGDRGPNTGGMGAFSVDSLVSADLERTILEKVVRPTLAGMAREGHPYQGFLYSGLMLTKDGPRVLEFNCRMGDPECQAIVARMDFDLAETLSAAASGELQGAQIHWQPAASACIVLASSGYPGHYETGRSIAGLDEAERAGPAALFHAGTKKTDSGYVTAGGRVLGVTATGADIGEAVTRAYRAAEAVKFGGCFYRKDIGTKQYDS